MGQGLISLFAVTSILAIAFLIAWLTCFRGAQSRFVTVIAGMMTAGILGNLYDRMGLHHLIWNYPSELHEVGQPVYAVRDWILVMIGDWPWPNFNIADSLLVVGVSLLFIATFFFPQLIENPKTESEKSSSSNAVEENIQNTKNRE
jgi:signal peptidase II